MGQLRLGSRNWWRYWRDRLLRRQMWRAKYLSSHSGWKLEWTDLSRYDFAKQEAISNAYTVSSMPEEIRGRPEIWWIGHEVIPIIEHRRKPPTHIFEEMYGPEPTATADDPDAPTYQSLLNTAIKLGAPYTGSSGGTTTTSGLGGSGADGGV